MDETKREREIGWKAKAVGGGLYDSLVCLAGQ